MPVGLRGPHKQDLKDCLELQLCADNSNHCPHSGLLIATYDRSGTSCAGAYKCCLRFFLLFQHQTTPELSRSMNGLFGPPGTYSWCRQFGPRVAIVGPDCRAERTVHRILTPQAYEALFAQYACLSFPHWAASAISVSQPGILMLLVV